MFILKHFHPFLKSFHIKCCLTKIFNLLNLDVKKFCWCNDKDLNLKRLNAFCFQKFLFDLFLWNLNILATGLSPHFSHLLIPLIFSGKILCKFSFILMLPFSSGQKLKWWNLNLKGKDLSSLFHNSVDFVRFLQDSSFSRREARGDFEMSTIFGKESDVNVCTLMENRIWLHFPQFCFPVIHEKKVWKIWKVFCIFFFNFHSLGRTLWFA